MQFLILAANTIATASEATSDSGGGTSGFQAFLDDVWQRFESTFIVDDRWKFRVTDAKSMNRMRHNTDLIYARYGCEEGSGNKIPIWLFGFLY